MLKELLYVLKSFHRVALEGLDEQHPNLQEARFLRDAVVNLPFQGLIQPVHEHQAGGSVVGSIVGVILGVLDGCHRSDVCLGEPGMIHDHIDHLVIVSGIW